MLTSSKVKCSSLLFGWCHFCYICVSFEVNQRISQSSTKTAFVPFTMSQFTKHVYLSRFIFDLWKKVKTNRPWKNLCAPKFDWITWLISIREKTWHKLHKQYFLSIVFLFKNIWQIINHYKKGLIMDVC